MSEREFGQLLSVGIHHISTRENKQLQIVEDELGYTVKRSGCSAIRYWRQGHLPAKPSDVETLARVIVQRGHVDRTWLERFLRSANHPNLPGLCDELFPNHRHPYLPSPPTVLIDREGDITTTLAKLKDSHVRLLTLTGAPGVGKTRLALQLAADLRPVFADGVAFVPLASVRDPELVPTAIAGALGLIETDNQTVKTNLFAFLQDRRLLLLMDNFEHVIPAAPYLAELLLTAPHLKIVATSRELLHIYGEHEYPVRPLALPAKEECVNLESVSRVPSVQLFVERAKAANPKFQLNADNVEAVADICIRLDGLPLAIELVAMRSKLLTPHTMLDLLSDRLALLVGGPCDLPARQQTLQAAIDWSYELLRESGKKLFRQLGVFLGGCPAEAILSLGRCSNLTNSQMLQVLEGLVEKNLLQVVSSVRPGNNLRYTMLETIREYACYQLQESGEAEEARRQHLYWYVELAEEAEKHLRGPEQFTWLNRLDQEINNLRAALTWCIEHPAEVESGLSLIGTLRWFWHLRSHGGEAGEWLDKLLAIRIDPNSPPSLRRKRAKALCVAGHLSWSPDNIPKAIAFAEAGLALFREIGDESGIALALTDLSMFASQQGDIQRAVKLATEARTLCEAIGDKFGIAQLIDNVFGKAAFVQGDYARTKVLHEEALALRQEVGDVDGIAWSLFLLARTALAQGNTTRAQALYEESRTIWQTVGNRRWYANAGLELGNLALNQRRYSQAGALYQESLEMYESCGARHQAARALCALGIVAREQHDYEQSQVYLRQLSTSVRALNHTPLAAEYLIAAAGLACATGTPERAARLMGAAQSALGMTTAFVRTVNRTQYDQVLTATRAALKEEIFNRVCTEGQRMPLNTAVAYAVGEISSC